MSTPHATPPAADRRTLIADTAIDLVAAAGLRGLTHRAVDGAAKLPAGSTSYYFRTRTALIGACYARLAELDLADIGDGRAGGQGDGDGSPVLPCSRRSRRWTGRRPRRRWRGCCTAG